MFLEKNNDFGKIRSHDFRAMTRKVNSTSRKTKDHLPNNDKAARTYFLEKTEPYFLVIFTAESGPRSIEKFLVSDWFTNNPVTLNVDLSPEDTFHGICLSQRILPS